MPIVDSHVHLYPPEANADPAAWAAAHGEARWALLCARRRRDGRPVQDFPGLDGLLRAMDAAGIGRAVLLGWYWEHPSSCAWQNRFFAACVRRHPDRLAACAAFHPGGGRAALAEVKRAREEGFAGLGELSPHSQGYPSDDPVFLEALGLAGELRLPVNLHVTDPDGRLYPGRIATPPEDFVRLARQGPATVFILSHWGGLLPLREPAVPPNVYYDTAASPRLYDAGIWRRFVARAGADRLLFGSDFPLHLYPGTDADAGLARLCAEASGSGLDPASLDAILRGNAVRLGFSP